MSTPTIHVPHVSLPDVPHVDVSQLADKAQGVAAAAVERAGELASAAAEKLEDLELTEKAIGLAGAVIPALRPTPKRSKTPFLLIVLLVVAAVGGGWWFKRRRASNNGGAAYPAPTHSEAAVTAAS
jgi:hypothetical protein